MTDNIPALVIGFFAATIVLFFMCREIMCWYWKINRIIELLEKIANKTESVESKTPPPVNTLNKRILE